MARILRALQNMQADYKAYGASIVGCKQQSEALLSGGNVLNISFFSLLCCLSNYERVGKLR